jgi:hypothetical protein
MFILFAVLIVESGLCFTISKRCLYSATECNWKALGFRLSNSHVWVSFIDGYNLTYKMFFFLSPRSGVSTIRFSLENSSLGIFKLRVLGEDILWFNSALFLSLKLLRMLSLLPAARSTWSLRLFCWMISLSLKDSYFDSFIIELQVSRIC